MAAGWRAQVGRAYPAAGDGWLRGETPAGRVRCVRTFDARVIFFQGFRLYWAIAASEWRLMGRNNGHFADGFVSVLGQFGHVRGRFVRLRGRSGHQGCQRWADEGRREAGAREGGSVAA